MTRNNWEHPKIVSRPKWLAARKDLLAEEKELTRARDRLSAHRRELPWVKVAQNYSFHRPAGTKTLAELFDGRSQLIVYHFMWRGDLNDGCWGVLFWPITSMALTGILRSRRIGQTKECRPIPALG